MSEQPFEPCRIVDLEWDRAHDSFTAIVRAESSAGFVVSEVHDLSPLDGLRWIRADEVVSVEDVAHDSPIVRLADHRGSRTQRLDTALTELGALLDSLCGTAGPIAVYTERTGSGELLVGTEVRVMGGRLELDEVDSGGELTGESLVFDLGEIIGVDWGTTYLGDLADLALAAEGQPASTSPD
jgi:hypothetical protein